MQMNLAALKINRSLRFLSAMFAVVLSIVSVEVEARTEAFLERNEIYINETVTLVLESSVAHGPSPDVIALRRDFDVETGNTNSRTKIVNGAQFSLTRWTYLLTPKKTGTFTIPAIVVRGEITVPMTLTVTDVPEDIKRETATHAKAELEVVDGDLQPYVQQQLILSLRLMYDDTVTSGESTDPVVENAVVEKFRGEQNYTTERDGRQYRVYEQRFVISAESSGELVIPAITFSGMLSTGGRSRPQVDSSFEERIRRMLRGTPLENDPFFMEENFSVDRRNTGRPFKVDSNEIRLNVRPRPPELGSAPWLPAKDLVIADSWESNPPQLQAGQPVQRRLIVQAKGLVASQIPDLDIVKPDNARMYMEPAFSDTPTDSQSINGQREHVITYIPDQAGTLVIPEVKVDWWNTELDSAQTTMLDALTLDVLAGVGAVDTVVDDESASTSEVAPVESASISSTDQSPSEGETRPVGADDDVVDTDSGSGWLRWLLSLPLLLTLVAVVGASLLWRWFVVRAAETYTDSPQSALADSLNHRLRSLQQAQTGADPKAASRALLRLAQHRWPQSPPRNLGALIDLLQDNGIDSKPVADLDRHLFSIDESPWDAAAMRKYLNPRIWTSSKPVTRQNRAAGLAPLYPRRLTSASGESAIS